MLTLTVINLSLRGFFKYVSQKPDSSNLWLNLWKSFWFRWQECLLTCQFNYEKTTPIQLWIKKSIFQIVNKEASKIISAKFENSLDLICLRFLLILFSSQFLMIKAPQLGVQKSPNEQKRELIFWEFSISCAILLKHIRHIEV